MQKEEATKCAETEACSKDLHSAETLGLPPTQGNIPNVRLIRVFRSFQSNYPCADGGAAERGGKEARGDRGLFPRLNILPEPLP